MSMTKEERRKLISKAALRIKKSDIQKARWQKRREELQVMLGDEPRDTTIKIVGVTDGEPDDLV